MTCKTKVRISVKNLSCFKKIYKLVWRGPSVFRNGEARTNGQASRLGSCYLYDSGTCSRKARHGSSQSSNDWRAAAIHIGESKCGAAFCFAEKTTRTLVSPWPFLRHNSGGLRTKVAKSVERRNHTIKNNQPLSSSDVVPSLRSSA